MPVQKVISIGATSVPESASAQSAQSTKLPFVHVSSFDGAINGISASNSRSMNKNTNNNNNANNQNKILRIDGSGPVQVVLFSTGIVATCSSDPNLHGLVIPFPQLASGEKIVDVAAGESHFVACDSKGRVYTWGWSNEFGQLGRGSIFSPRPDLVDAHEPVWIGPNQFGEPLAVVDVSSSNQNNNNNNNGSSKISTIIQGEVPHKIVSVACGRQHTVLLTENRKCVFVFGRGHRGQLGLKDTVKIPGTENNKNSAIIVVDFVPSPRSVPALFGLPIRQISCSSSAHHTLVVLESGHLIAMGENMSGNLGVGSFSEENETSSANHRASHSHCFVPTVVEIDVPSAEDQQQQQQQQQQINNNQNISKFPQLPRRMKPLIPVDRKTNLPLSLNSPSFVPISYVDSSSLHTAVVDKNHHLLTAGAPPNRLQNGDQPVDALGPLGRKINTAADSSFFGPVPQFFIDLTSEDSVVCGNGFTAVLLKRHNAVFVSGAIQAKARTSQVSVGAGAEARGWLELELPNSKNVMMSQIFSCGHGLLAVISEQ